MCPININEVYMRFTARFLVVLRNKSKYLESENKQAVAVDLNTQNSGPFRPVVCGAFEFLLSFS